MLQPSEKALCRQICRQIILIQIEKLLNLLNIINIILLKGTISNRFSIQPFGMFYLSVSVLVSSFIFLSEYKQQCNWTPVTEL